MPGKNDHFKKKIDFSNEFFAFTQTVLIAFVHLAITITVKNCESPNKIIVIIIIMIITIIMNNEIDDDNNIDGDDDNNSNINNNNDNGNCNDKQIAM